MFKKGKKLSVAFKRQGTTRVKTLFKVKGAQLLLEHAKRVHNYCVACMLVIGVSLHKKDISQNPISVCFERGGKTSCTRELPIPSCDYDDNGIVKILFEETLSLVVTMYKNKVDDFQVRFLCITTDKRIYVLMYS